MKLLELLVEKIKNFFNKPKVVAEVKVIQPKPAAPKKEEKAQEVVESTSPVVIGEEAFKQAQLDALAKKEPVAPVVVEEAPVASPVAAVAEAIVAAPVVESAPVVEEAPKKSKRKYYHKRKPKAK